MNINKYSKNPFNNNFKTFPNYIQSIKFLLKLNDGRLACSGNKILNIYHKNSFELQIEIKEHSNYINSFTQLNDGKIITCSNDKTMKIIELINEEKYKVIQILNHHSPIFKIIEIKNNELISISEDGVMKVWILNNNKLFENILNIKCQKWSYCNILKLNKKEFVTLNINGKFLKFWNSNNYTFINMINNIQSTSTLNSMCLLNDNLLCIGGIKKFYLIQISNHQLIKIILGINRVYSIKKCLDNLFLCSIINENKHHCLIKYKIENENFEKVYEKEKAHKTDIWCCTELNNEIIVSVDDLFLKLWKF